MKLYCISIKSKRSMSFFLLVSVVFLTVLEFLNVGSDLSFIVRTNQDRIDVINSYGYDVFPEATEIKSIIIPQTFTDVYEDYNKIQLQAGFNLKDYCGNKATVYKYKLKNSSDTKFLNLIVCDDIIIGGDITDAKLDGAIKPFQSINK